VDKVLRGILIDLGRRRLRIEYGKEIVKGVV